TTSQNRVQNRNDDFLNTGANRNAQKQRRLRNLILVRRYAAWIVHRGLRRSGNWLYFSSARKFQSFTWSFAKDVARPVFGSADRCGADRTSDRAGAAREGAARCRKAARLG